MSTLRTMLLYAFATFSAKGVAFLMLPFVTAFLSLEEYGKLNLLASFSCLASIFIACGLAETLYRFASTKDSHVNLFYSAICFKVAFKIAAVFAVVSWLGHDIVLSFLPAVIDPNAFKLLLVSLTFSSLLTVPFVYWRMTGQALPFVVFSLTQVILQSGLSLLLLHMELGVVGMMTASAASSVLVSGAILIKFYPLLATSSGLSSKHMQYVFYVVFASLLLYGVGGAENWIIANQLGVESLAIYFLVSQFGLMISVSFEPFRMWWYARRQSLLSDKSNANAIGATGGFELGILLCIGMLIMGPLVISAILPLEYQIANDYLMWISWVLAFKFHSELFNIGCYVKSNAQWSVVVNGCAALVMIASGLVLVHHLALIGVLLAVLLANMTRALLFFIISQKLLYQAYPREKMAKAWLALSVSSIGSYFDAHLAVLITFMLYLTAVGVQYKTVLMPTLLQLHLAVLRIKTGSANA